MTNEERKRRIELLEHRISEMEDELHHLVSECPCDAIVNVNDAAICDTCGYDHGWYCPKSPDHTCEYDNYETCVYCGHPEERK